MATTVNPGQAVSVSGTAIGAHPKWLKPTSASAIGGTAKLPSGYRRLVSISGARAQTDYFISPVQLPPSDAPWRMAIYADNGSYIYADALKGIPTIGTPVVRLAKDAPARAVVNLPVGRGALNVRSPSFAGWSDGHAEEIKRGQELTVEYRGPNGLTMVFRGMIYQISSGDTIEVVAYDRLMDLYQFSDQYQSNRGRNPETLPLNSSTASAFIYIASRDPGILTECKVKSILSINALHHMTKTDTWPEGISTLQTWEIEGLPAFSGYSPQQGSTITQVSIKGYVYNDIQGRAQSFCVGLFRITGNTITMIDRTAIKYVGDAHASVGSTVVDTLTWDVNWTIEGDPSQYRIGAYHDMGKGSFVQPDRNTPYTIDKNTCYYYSHGNTTLTPSDDFSQWTHMNADASEYAIKFDYEATVPTNDVTLSGTTVSVPKSDTAMPSGDCISTVSAAYQAYIDYQIYNATSLVDILSDLIKWAGLTPNIDQGANLGTTTFYTSTTFDYMTCAQELIKGANYGLRASIAEAGKIDVFPKHTIDDTPVASFTITPGGSGEQQIIGHNITAHWMAEKATQAYLSENMSTKRPIALETDDALMTESLCEGLQSPLRAITADNTLGTQQLLATSAGGKMNQLHTNVFEGDITLDGYRTDLWSLLGNNTGGNPISIEIPEYGANGTAVPTQIEIGNGTTKVMLDNIRTADRSEAANSMGLTADALSNTSQTLPSCTYIFVRYDDYSAEVSGLTPASVSSVEFLNNSGTVLATQNDGNYIECIADAAGYYHVTASLPTSSAGYASSSQISMVRWTMGGVTRTAPLDNPRYSLAGQALHVDIRFRKA